jgi:hypothetical protein
LCISKIVLAILDDARLEKPTAPHLTFWSLSMQGTLQSC